MMSRVNAELPLESRDLDSERNLAMRDNNKCPLSFLLKDGKCYFSRHKRYYINNGREGLGLKLCPVIPVICGLVDGNIRLSEVQAQV